MQYYLQWEARRQLLKVVMHHDHASGHDGARAHMCRPEASEFKGFLGLTWIRCTLES